MPYINKKERARLTTPFKDLLIMDEGELNFAACQLFMRYIDSQEGTISYKKISSGLAGLEEAAAEIRRRILAGYEHQKIISNGDIFTDFIRKHNIREFS